MIIPFQYSAFSNLTSYVVRPSRGIYPNTFFYGITSLFGTKDDVHGTLLNQSTSVPYWYEISYLIGTKDYYQFNVQ